MYGDFVLKNALITYGESGKQDGYKTCNKKEKPMLYTTSE